MKIGSKTCWRFLFAVGLIAILSPPQPTLAQEERVALSLWLRDGWYRQEVKAGQDNNLSLEVRNTGTVPITNIRLSSEKPEDWIIELEPAEINSLSPDSTQTVDVNIRPIGKATKTEHKITLIAQANETRAVQTVWITVKPTSFWLWIWAVVGAIIIAGFVFLFIRLNRSESNEAGSTV